MVHTIWIVPPTGPAFAQLRPGFIEEAFRLRPLPRTSLLPNDDPLVLLADLTGTPRRVLDRLRHTLTSRPDAPFFLLLVDDRSLDDIITLTSLGDCTLWHISEPPAVFIERARAIWTRHRERQRVQRFNAVIPLYHIAQFFADATDLDKLLQRVLETALHETEADRGSIMLLEEEAQVLYVAAAVGLPEEVLHHHRQKVGEGIAGWVAQHHQPLILTEGEIPPFALSWLRGRNAYSSISVPMIHQGKTVGVLNLTKAPGKIPFREGDVEFITILASQAATAIRNARLFSQVQAALDELRQLDRLRTQIIDIAAHELRTPVAVIKGYIELLEETADDELARYLAPIHRNVRRLESLVRDLFELSTVRALGRTPQPRSVETAAWVLPWLERYRERAGEKHITLSSAIAPDAETAWFDQEHVAAILHHLLTNAIKFTPEEGTIEVRLEKENARFLIHVDDSGPGIPESERERIFRDFYQVEDVSTREHEGLGIGLTLARTLASAHNIRICVDDSPLGGARFTLVIPQPVEN